MSQNLAILLTCHNRKIKTLACLASLYQSEGLQNWNISYDVFLVDDGSTDDTAKAVASRFPEVTIIQGTGHLFWNQGMRLAWHTARQSKDYDFYLWLNDDVILEKNGPAEMFKCYFELTKKEQQPSIIVGTCMTSKHEKEFSYGGKDSNDKALIPNGNPQKCTFINGNVVLISRHIHNILGNLSPEYTHAMGDVDYGLRAIQKGIHNYITTQYVGVCPKNGTPKWSDPKVPLRERIQAFRAPTGLCYTEYLKFRKKFWKKTWRLYAIKAYCKMLVPLLYNNVKKVLT